MAMKAKFPEDFIGKPCIMAEYDENNNIANYHGAYILALSDTGQAMKLAPLDENLRGFDYWMPVGIMRLVDTMIEEEGEWPPSRRTRIVDPTVEEEK